MPIGRLKATKMARYTEDKLGSSKLSEKQEKFIKEKTSKGDSVAVERVTKGWLNGKFERTEY